MYPTVSLVVYMFLAASYDLLSYPDDIIWTNLKLQQLYFVHIHTPAEIRTVYHMVH